MQQQVQTHLSPDQVLGEASSFFSKRRAKISDRASDGFRFGLQGSDETGRVSITTSGGAGSTVTVEADGLGVLAIAEGYVRELRKQAQVASRQTRPGGGVALGDLRQRLGMPEPVRPQPQRRPPTPTNQGGQAVTPGTERPEGASGASTQAATPTASTTPAVQSETASPAAATQAAATVAAVTGGAGFADTGSTSTAGTRPDGPAPVEAAEVSPETGPHGAPAGASAVEAAHPSFVGPGDSNATPAPDSPPVDQGTSNVQPSAEALGGVPAAGEVVVHNEPSRPNPGTPAGPAGSATQAEVGQEAGEAPGHAARQGGEGSAT